MRQGKCVDCKVAYRFKHPKRLKDAFCPKCGRRLQATTRELKRFPWIQTDVADAAQAARILYKKR